MIPHSAWKSRGNHEDTVHQNYGDPQNTVQMKGMVVERSSPSTICGSHLDSGPSYRGLLVTTSLTDDHDCDCENGGRQGFHHAYMRHDDTHGGVYGD